MTFLTTMADRIREVLLRHFDRLQPGDISFKRRRDLLTVADSQTEAVILEMIRERFPEHSIIAEESGAELTGSEYCWIVDPLDGTTNFARSFPFFSASVALVFRGEPVLALVESPYLRERFVAGKGEGAYLNDTRLKVSDVKDVASAMLATGFAYVRNDVSQNNVADFSRLILACHDIRRAGAASVDLAYVAAGRFDGFWEPYLKPWDVAAGVLLVREAGGKVTDYSGGEGWMFGENIVATNGKLHDELRENLTPLDEGYATWGVEFAGRIRGEC